MRVSAGARRLRGREGCRRQDGRICVGGAPGARGGKSRRRLRNSSEGEGPKVSGLSHFVEAMSNSAKPEVADVDDVKDFTAFQSAAGAGRGLTATTR